MVRRFSIVAIVVAAFFVLAVPAFAFNGYRSDYTTSDYCSICHKVGQAGGAPKVYDAWSQTAHGTDAEAVSAAKSLPYGSVCAGCHTANFAPSKVVPTPTATSTSLSVSWGAVLPAGSPTPSLMPQALGNAQMSEFDVGCSSCHYGNDVTDTAHTSAFGDQIGRAHV